MDIHIHTSESSFCGKVPAEEMVKSYAEKEYNGLIITDHYNESFFKKHGNISWKEKVDKLLVGYQTAKKAGVEYGVDVFLGIEFREVTSPNDFLIYGITEEILYNHPEMYLLSLEEAVEIFKENGCLVFQAHPMRPKVSFLANPKLLDGIEVYNGNTQWDYDGKAAKEAADKYNIVEISASDFHQTNDLARGGIVFDSKIKDYSDFLYQLMNNGIKELIEE